ncbi:conserved protein of unknown function [Rhodovastum atsumiense]|nr:DOPA 4,5-dioxygenase family protein [Rhodovastum atsumiense]CAH2600875.1 conserved protein of unknown function [Rhodovastum atsumiense]
MFDDPENVGTITAWHAHVYFDQESRATAAWLRERVAEHHPAARFGHWHEVKVGPHPGPMYQIAFTSGDAALLIPFLALNRRGLTILVHPDTGRPRADHLEHALWMGAVLPLDAAALVERPK